MCTFIIIVIVVVVGGHCGGGDGKFYKTLGLLIPNQKER